VSAKTLISQKCLREKEKDIYEFINKDLWGVPYADNFYWAPGYEPMEMLKKEYLVLTVDLSEGIGNDYIICLINRMVNKDKDDLECVGFFRSNKLPRAYFTNALQTLICKYTNQEHILLSHEKNTYGDLFYRDMMDNLEKDPYISQEFDPAVLVKYYNDTNTRYSYGVRITSGNKSSYCVLFKESFERGKYINKAIQFMSELTNFVDDGTGHYKASFGHDDLVMSAVQLEFVRSTLQYKIMRDDFAMGKMPVADDYYYNPFESMDNIWDNGYIPGENESRLNRLM
jgi:hypothetical protein